jgi:hypothetical protein
VQRGTAVYHDEDCSRAKRTDICVPEEAFDEINRMNRQAQPSGDDRFRVSSHKVDKG